MKTKYEFKQIAIGVSVTGTPATDSILYGLSASLYEPVERNHDGVKHHRHRFPIKGGISLMDVMRYRMTKPDALYKHFFGSNNV